MGTQPKHEHTSYAARQEEARRQEGPRQEEVSWPPCVQAGDDRSVRERPSEGFSELALVCVSEIEALRAVCGGFDMLYNGFSESLRRSRMCRSLISFSI